MVLIRGIELSLHPEGEALSDHIRRENDFFEAEILDYMRDNHRVQNTIVDVGANIGNHSAYFANFLEYRQILAFEPVPDNYILLAKNCSYYPGFYPFKFAMSNQFETVRLTPNRGNMGASQISQEGTVEVIAVAVDMLSLYDVSLMKIDVEYYEPRVLQGAYATIRRNRPLILIEDANNEYGPLLPDYEVEKAWPHHITYLYKWRE